MKENKINCTWSPDLAYAVGLIVTDGCLSSLKKRITLTSKDKIQISNFKRCLGIENKIGRVHSGSTDAMCYRVQFGDKDFYDFLCRIGLMPQKTKKLNTIKIPEKYFFDFLRGHFDGDGTFYFYWDKRWKSSFMYYMAFYSASKPHLEWIRSKLKKKLGIAGYLSETPIRSTHILRYAKAASLKITKNLYYSDKNMCLPRKRLKIIKALSIMHERI